MLQWLISRWRSFHSRLSHNQKYEYLLQEFSALHEHTLAEFGRINIDVSALQRQAIPRLDDLNTQLISLQAYSVAAIDRISAELSDVGRLQEHVISEFARINADVGDVRGIVTESSRAVSEAIERNELLRGEQSRLHELVTVRLTAQLQFLNQQIYNLKRRVYHLGVSEDLIGFNGQFSKHEIFRDLLATFPFDGFVETGTYMGATTRFLAAHNKPVYSLEIDSASHAAAQAQLINQRHVRVLLGDSAYLLGHLTADLLADSDLIFFYLDAHWGDRVPLPDELNIIAEQHPRAVVVVDDFKIEDDEAYGYDSYPNGQEITIRFLDAEIRRHGWEVFFPRLPGVQDHMNTDILPPRGTAVMACDPLIISSLKQVASIRHWVVHNRAG